MLLATGALHKLFRKESRFNNLGKVQCKAQRKPPQAAGTAAAAVSVAIAVDGAVTVHVAVTTPVTVTVIVTVAVRVTVHAL